MNHCPKMPDPPPDHGDALDPATTRAFHALGKVFHLHRQAMHRRLSDPDTHHGVIMSLRLLAHSDGMSQRDLADTLHLSRPRVTSILQGLEKDGLIRRENDTDDQRITRVYLTEEGRRREMGYRAEFEAYVNSTIGALSDRDKEELARILGEVTANISALLCSEHATKRGEGGT